MRSQTEAKKKGGGTVLGIHKLCNSTLTFTDFECVLNWRIMKKDEYFQYEVSSVKILTPLFYTVQLNSKCNVNPALKINTLMSNKSWYKTRIINNLTYNFLGSKTCVVRHFSVLWIFNETQHETFPGYVKRDMCNTVPWEKINLYLQYTSIQESDVCRLTNRTAGDLWVVGLR